jgi:hypothetical protein
MTATYWTPTIVEAFLAEAADTLRRLPEHTVQGYFNKWPEIVPAGTDAGRMTRLVPSPSAIDQMDSVLLWLRWLERDDRRLVWQRANGRPWKAIAKDYGVDRAAAWRRWVYALVTIAARLNVATKNVQHIEQKW